MHLVLQDQCPGSSDYTGLPDLGSPGRGLAHLSSRAPRAESSRASVAMAAPRAGLREAGLAPLCRGVGGELPELAGPDPQGEGARGGLEVAAAGGGARGADEPAGGGAPPPASRSRIKISWALQQLTKTTPAALGGSEGGRLRTSAGRSLRWEALAGAPPVLRREPGHKEPSALAPQDRGPEVSRRPVLTALPP